MLYTWLTRRACPITSASPRSKATRIAKGELENRKSALVVRGPVKRGPFDDTKGDSLPRFAAYGRAAFARSSHPPKRHLVISLAVLACPERSCRRP